jgi:hypothetical protein
MDIENKVDNSHERDSNERQQVYPEPVELVVDDP